MEKKAKKTHRSTQPPQASEEDRAWLDMAPVGREFGSPDYERLTALDRAAFAAFQSWEQVRDWLSAPNPQLDGASPEDASRAPEGFGQVMSILVTVGGRASENLPVQERDSLMGLTEIKSLKGMFGRPTKRVSIDDMNAAIVRRSAKKK